MTRAWNYICCCVRQQDQTDFDHAYGNRVRPRIRKSKSKKSHKSTWTRRSLLDNEHSECNEIPFEQLGYQMKPISPAVDRHNDKGNGFDKKTPTNRIPIQDIFAYSTDPSQRSQTTFPWMDEQFKPIFRADGPRLGISSVKMNVQRNEVARRSRDLTPIPVDPRSNTVAISNNIGYTPSLKSQSFTEGEYGTRTNAVNVRNVNQTGVSNVRTIPNGHGYRSNITKATNKASTVARPMGVSAPSARQTIIHSPKSDVGVRGLVSTGHTNNKIPRTEDYPDTTTRGNSQMYNISKYTPNPDVINKFPKSVKQNVFNENHSDVSFSSEVTFRKSETSYCNSDVSYRRSNQPSMLSPNAGKYERMKEPKLKRLSKVDKTNTVESMYKYVPKATQNVHASNALEGNRIDDFFIQRMNSRELDNFAKIDPTEEDMVSDTGIITSFVDNSDRNGQSTQSNISEAKSKHSHFSQQNYTRKTDNTCKPHEATTWEENGDIEHIKLLPPLDKDGSRHKLDTKSPRSTFINITSGKTITQTENSEDQIIMIDFPPNLNNDNKNRSSKFPLKVADNHSMTRTPASVQPTKDVDTSIVSTRSHNSSVLQNVEVLY